LVAFSSPPAPAEPLIEDEDDALPPAALEPLEALSEGSEEDEEEPPADALPPVVDDWLVCAPWFIVDEEFTSVDDWFAETLEFVVLLPLPTFTPGLMFAPALMSVLLTPTLASTPTFGLTWIPELAPALGEVVLVDDDWLLDVPWLMVEVEFVSVEDWFAETLLSVD
jgi:hypothetical protein